jgi:hypothetical protein
MAKTSQELTDRAKKLLEQAKQIQEKEFIKVGKFVMKLHQQNKITDQNFLNQLNKLFENKLVSKSENL